MPGNVYVGTSDKKRHKRGSSLRIAFLTPEFVTSNWGSGGLATYIDHVVSGLKRCGHDPEIFTLGTPSVEHVNGIRIETVNNWRTFPVRLVRKIAHICPGIKVDRTLRFLCGAWALARAFEKRHAQRPFDAVQSSNFGLAGFFISQRPGDPRHLVRCSSSRRLWKSMSNQKVSIDHHLMDVLERHLIGRADFAYAPSRFLAHYFREHHGLKVRVVRPPCQFTLECSKDLPAELPERYLVHFGLLGVRKGTDIVVDALCLALEKEPDLTMVLVGNEARRGELNQLYARVGYDRTRLVWLGPLPRPELYRVVAGAEAAVLPSRVDNLPNTVIESLALGVPVIGTDGASIDELVTDGVNGLLVPVGDANVLAAAMLDAWCQTERWNLIRMQSGQLLTLGDECDPIEELCAIAAGQVGDCDARFCVDQRVVTPW